MYTNKRINVYELIHKTKKTESVSTHACHYLNIFKKT